MEVSALDQELEGHKKLVDSRMEEDNETTATQLHKMLSDKGYNLSLETIIRCRSQLGWTYHGSKYCQLVHTCTRNVKKRLIWAKQCQEYN